MFRSFWKDYIRNVLISQVRGMIPNIFNCECYLEHFRIREFVLIKDFPNWRSIEQICIIIGPISRSTRLNLPVHNHSGP